MGGVVVGVRGVVVGLDQGQPVLQDILLYLQRLRHLEPQQDVHPQPQQRPTNTTPVLCMQQLLHKIIIFSS